MVLSRAHYTKSWGCDGGDVLGMILRPLASASSWKVGVGDSLLTLKTYELLKVKD